MKRFQVIRTHTSPYQGQEFLSLERQMVESFPSLSYETLETAKDLETILITNTHTNLAEIPRHLLNQTVLIVHPNSGYDNFSESRELWMKTAVVIGHEVRAQAVAEYTIGAIFEGAQELPQHLMWNKERKWERKLLKDMPVWIFGYGHIGKIIASTLAALGMKITVIDPYEENCPYPKLSRWKDGDLKEAKIVVVAMGLNPTNVQLFNEVFFNHASSEMLFINGARGKLVDENALKSFLLTHPESFAFLDVFPDEPFGEEWHGFPQVWKTSHIAGVEKDLDQKILCFEEKVLNSFCHEENEIFQKRFEKELLQNKLKKGILI